MITQEQSDRAWRLQRPRRLFPLVRHLSHPATGALLRLPVTPNQITLASIVLGLTAAWHLAAGEIVGNVVGAVLLTISYVLDNCDGEVARIKRLESRWGARLDDVGDWLVNSTIFICLGIGLTHSTDASIWTWLGVASAAGATINYGLVLFIQARDPGNASVPPAEAPRPQTFSEKLIYVFRALCRADFCFILLALALADMLWILMPAAAVGAQVFWAMALIEGARRFHV